MMFKYLRNRDRSGDEGFTLAELIVYSLILVIVLGIGATLLVRTITMQRDVREMADASNTAQLSFQEVERDLRNASWVRISSNGSLMVMRTRVAAAGNDQQSRCVGYYLDTASGDMHRTSSYGPSDTAAALSATTIAELQAATSTWPVTRSGVGVVDSEPAFGPSDGSYDTHNYVTVSLEAETIGDRPPVLLDTSVTLRKQADISGACA